MSLAAWIPSSLRFFSICLLLALEARSSADMAHPMLTLESDWREEEDDEVRSGAGGHGPRLTQSPMVSVTALGSRTQPAMPCTHPEGLEWGPRSNMASERETISLPAAGAAAAARGRAGGRKGGRAGSRGAALLRLRRAPHFALARPLDGHTLARGFLKLCLRA